MHRPTVWLAEDDRVISDLLAPWLTKAGFEVVVGYASVPACPCDAAVIDWNLQQRSGLDLAVEFADTHPSARIILMSGLDLSDEANRSCGGRAVFLQKPFAPSVLVELLNRLLA